MAKPSGIREAHRLPLRDRSALSIAFGGCGVSMAEAQRRTGTPTNDVGATLDLLGQLLMVAGETCLPGPTHNRTQSTADEARAWKTLTAEQQLANLKILMGMLTNPPTWRQSSELASAHKPMLPTEMGRWDGHRDMPSCFGMLVILASYGYITRSPMLVGSVQRMSAEPVTAGLRSIYGAAHRLIAAEFPLAYHADTLPRWLSQAVADAKDSMHLMLTRREFHGAIVLRLRDGRWISMDPYMQNMAILDQVTDRGATCLIGDPVASATVLGQREWGVQPQLEKKFNTVRGILELARTGTILGEDVPLEQLAVILCDLMADHCGFEALDPDDLLRRAVVAPDANELPEIATARAMVATADTSSHRQCIRERILLGVLREWASEVWHAGQRTRANEPHHAMMLSAPERTLAAWSVVNLRHRLNARVHGIDLLPYSGTDVVLYNALVDHSNGRSRPEELWWLNERKAGFLKAPPYLLHPLILEALDQ
ncbi:MAG TPA: hypothetical protein VJM32_03715 [Candidatus Saccharimonadales bacterium]|nr:hypothetical protein [Candidatus Saccharimonadales bacterium]